MPISPPWDENSPDNSDPANTLGASDRNIKSQVRQLINQLIGLAEATALSDPVVDGSTIKTLSQLTAALASILTGSGSANSLAKWTGTTELGVAGLTEAGGVFSLGGNIIRASSQLRFRTVKSGNQDITGFSSANITFPNATAVVGGLFTAPATALYLLGVDIFMSGLGTGRARLLLNNVTTLVYQNISGSIPAKLLIPIQLNQGDEVVVDVDNISGTVIIAQTATHFWGVQLW